MPYSTRSLPRRAGPSASARKTVERSDDLGIGPLRTVPIALRQCSVEPEAVLASVGLTLAVLDDSSARIGFPTVGRLLEACSSATDKPHFALLAGAQFELPMLGPLGYLMRNEATVGAALRSLVLHSHLHDRGAVPALLRISARRMGLGYAVYARETPMRGMIDDAAMMIAQRMLERLCGRKWQPLEVRLAHAAPADVRPYKEAFGAPVRFNAALSTIVFESRWMDEPVMGADPELRRMLREQLAAMELEVPRDLTGRVQRILRTGVLAGTGNAAQVAGMFAMSERTMRRHLASEGTSLHALTAEARLLAAQQLIEETWLSLSDIAQALKYSDASALSRAFKGWTGIAPSQWRGLRALPGNGAPSAVADAKRKRGRLQ